MTKIKILKNDGNFVGFVVKGHSGYAESGNDLVCASISILVYTVLNSLNEVAGVAEEDMDVNIDEKKGFTSLKLKKVDYSTEVIFNVFIVGITMLAESYSDYVTLMFEEV